MSLSLEDKKAVVAEVSEQLKGAQAAMLAEYRGLTVEQMTKLRRKAHEGKVYLRVVKNTLARRAAQGTSPSLTGPEFNGRRRQWELGEHRKLGVAGLRRRQKRRWPDLG